MEDLFQTALGISSPWYIESLKFDVETSRLDIFIDFKRGMTFTDNESNQPPILKSNQPPILKQSDKLCCSYLSIKEH